MDERMRFVIRRQDGESMDLLCRQFGISRKSGYKIIHRFEQCGLEGLSDRARRPHRYANQIPGPIEAGSVGPIGNSIVVIDPNSGSIVSSTFIGSDPNRLAVSRDGSFVYAALAGDQADKARIARMNLVTGKRDLVFTPPPRSILY